MISFSCPCGFTYEGEDFDELEHEPLYDCCNCGGQKCMNCVLRNVHDKCRQDCPDCCG